MSYVVPVKSKVKISQNFVAFSEHELYSIWVKFFKVIPKMEMVKIGCPVHILRHPWSKRFIYYLCHYHFALQLWWSLRPLPRPGTILGISSRSKPSWKKIVKSFNYFFSPNHNIQFLDSCLSKWFWSGQDRFDRIQIIFFSFKLDFSGLFFIIWTCQKLFGPYQNKLNPSKTIRTQPK